MTEDTDSELRRTADAKVNESSPPYPVFPEPSAPLAPSHRISPISWADYMDEIEPMLRRYLRDHDRPEDRLAKKIPERFVWDV